MVYASSNPPAGEIYSIGLTELSIVGTGAMPPYSQGSFLPPWRERDAPVTLDVIPGVMVKVVFHFGWAGQTGTITFRLGTCEKFPTHMFEWDVVRVDVPVIVSSHPYAYQGTGIFTYEKAMVTKLYLLPEGIKYQEDGEPADNVFLNAFNPVEALLSDLKITSYSRK